MKYPLVEFLRSSDKGERPEPPAPRTSHVAVGRSNYRVHVEEISLWQFAFLKACDHPTSSYSAVRGMLRLLEDKGFLRHEWEGPRYVYLPTADPEQIRNSAVRHLLHTFFSNSMESAVAAMLGAAEKPPTDEELKRMSKLIEAQRKKGRS